MPELLAWMVLYSLTSNECDCRAIAAHKDAANSLGFIANGLYAYKRMQFLYATASGMGAETEWCGDEATNCGYVIETVNGEAQTYFPFDKEKFKQFLFESTRLECVSNNTHDCAVLYEEGEKMLMKLSWRLRRK